MPLVQEYEWSREAEKMCEAAKDEDMDPPVHVHENDTETKAALQRLRRLTSGGPR